MPREAPIDLYLVEVDINNDPSVTTVSPNTSIQRLHD